MIHLKKKHTVPAPVILTDQGVAETSALCTKYIKGNADFEFDNNIYGHGDVKNLLRTVQDGKCCFCEAKIAHISYGDVEHYRPKAGWIQKDEKLNRPGYYWLAYEWDNLFLSCEICNQRHKRNYFPLSDNTKRAISHAYPLKDESPIFIKPDTEDPEKFIEFREEIPFPTDGNLRGAQTIEKLGLDREALNERRREKLGLIRDIYNLAKDTPVTTPEIKLKAVNLIKKRVLEFTADNAEYSAMFRAFFKKNPVDF
jgi:uncharacterized protein (TIGR02646 family)